MNSIQIQVGLPCEPDGLCQAIEIAIGILVLLTIVGLIRVIARENRKK